MQTGLCVDQKRKEEGEREKGRQRCVPTNWQVGSESDWKGSKKGRKEGRKEGRKVRCRERKQTR